MSFCVRCGNITRDSDQFCASCGASIGPSATPSIPVDPRIVTRTKFTRHRIVLVIGATVLVVLAVALVFGLGYARRDQDVTATLTVNVLPTEAVAATPTYPTTVAVRLPRKWAHSLGAYGVAGTVLLAPVEWMSKNAVIGQDGSRRACLRATGSAMSGQLDYESERESNVAYIWQTAAEYFPWLRNDWSSTSGNSALPPTPLPGLVEQPVGDQLVRYSMKSGALVTAGLQVNGVAQTTLTPSSLLTPGFDRLEVALPPQDHALATIILNYFVTHDGQ